MQKRYLQYNALKDDIYTEHNIKTVSREAVAQ